MKQIISTFLLSSMFALTSVMPVTAAWPSTDPSGSDFEAFYDLDGYYELVEPSESAVIKPCRAGTVRVRSRTSTKKKVVHSAIAGGIGTAIGAGIGGKRGALIGLGSGAGGYLLYRYVKDRKGNCVRRYVGRG